VTTLAEVKLFEIPIYSMRPEVFRNRWNKKLQSFSSLTYAVGTQQKKVVDLFKGKTIWEYNQIIGFIIISARASNAIYLSLYLPKEHLFRYNSSNKHFMIKQEHSGLHFYIRQNDTNKTITDNIEEQIEFIKSKFLQKSWYVDDSAFKCISPYVDFKTIIKNI
jgi:hypothetical protein